MHDLETIMGWTFYSGMLKVLNYSSDDEKEAHKLLFNSTDEVLNEAYKFGKFAIEFDDTTPTHKIPKGFDEVKLKNLIHISLTSLHEQNHVKQVSIYPSVLLNGTLKSLLFNFIKSFIKEHHSNHNIKIPIVKNLDTHTEFNKYALRGKWYYELTELIAGTKSEMIEDCLKKFQYSFKESFVSNINTNGQSNPFDFTLNDILEAECRQLDNTILYRWHSIGVDIDFIEEIYQELICSPTYTKAFKYFLDELQPSREFGIKIFLLTIHLALWTDVLYFEKTVLWEDISIPWRFFKIVQWFKNNKNIYANSFDDLIARICFELKWKTPREIALKHIRLRNQILAGCLNDFDKDFYERHFDYCYHLLKEGYVPNLYIGIALENRFYPWCVYKKDLGLVIQNAPSNIDSRSLIQYISMLRTSIALYFTGDLNQAKTEYDMLTANGKYPSLNYVSSYPVGNFETFLQSVFGIKSENVLSSK
jgi:hypothetical protein